MTCSHKLIKLVAPDDKGSRYRCVLCNCRLKLHSGVIIGSEFIRGNDLIILRSGHALVVKSLHDGHATCTCGKWELTHTGETTREHLESEFYMHAQMA